MEKVGTTGKRIRRQFLALLCLLIPGLHGQLQAEAAPANEMFGAMPQSGTKPVKKNTYVAPPPVQPANAVTAPGALSMTSVASPELTFFESLDSICFRGWPKEQERFYLSQNFDGELEKVERWTRTARGVAKRYRNTATALRNLQIPNGRVDLQEYKEMRAEWFDSAARVYEEMIKPKPPAQTMEELEAQLRKVDQDADAVKHSKTTILAMDRRLRKLYRVHEPRESDALQNYVMGVPKQK